MSSYLNSKVFKGGLPVYISGLVKKNPDIIYFENFDTGVSRIIIAIRIDELLLISMIFAGFFWINITVTKTSFRKQSFLFPETKTLFPETLIFVSGNKN